MGKKAVWAAAACLGLVLLSFGLSRTVEDHIPCYGDRIFTRVAIPENKNGVTVIFVPAPGYMDNQGRFGEGGEGAGPPQGVFEFFRERLNAAGYTTVQFDKPGVGSSSGRLAGEEELALLCAYALWDSLENSFSGQYFIFTYAGGGDYYRFAYNMMKNTTGGVTPRGIVQLAGLTNWHGFIKDDALHVLSVLGDTALLSPRIIKQRLENQIRRDSVSKVLIMEEADENLCSLSGEESLTRHCEYGETLVRAVLDWLAGASIERQQEEEDWDSLEGY
jgi:hypothetical protein